MQRPRKGRPSDPDQKGEGGVDKKSPIVVVVEDEPLVRVIIVDYLRENGCTVLEAASGEEAVALGWAYERLGCCRGV
jgi:response regulator RpfG family c-di-GMP phosphodiesterase